MNCPKCGKPLIEMWRETWGEPKRTSIVGRCEDCDFDGTWDLDKDNKEINFRQYFFG